MLHGLPKLIEDDEAAIEKRPPVDSQIDAVRRAIEQADAQGMLQVGNRLGHDRVGDRKLPCGLGHVSALHDREQNMQVAQLEPPPDSIIPLHCFCLAEWLNRCSKMRLFS